MRFTRDEKIELFYVLPFIIFIVCLFFWSMGDIPIRDLIGLAADREDNTN
jgi:hypothetical protein